MKKKIVVVLKGWLGANILLLKFGVYNCTLAKATETLVDWDWLDFLGLHKICSRSGCDAWLPNLKVGSQRFEGGRIKNTFGIRKFLCKTGETKLMRQLEAKHKSNCLSQKTKQRLWISKIKANGKFFLDHLSLTATSAFSLLRGERVLPWIDFLGVLCPQPNLKNSFFL